MSFENEYRAEMNRIRRNVQLDERILANMKAVQKRKIGSASKWRAVAAILAITCVIAIGMNLDKVTTYAESLYGSFKFMVGGQEILLDEITPLEFDFEALYEDAEVDEYPFGDRVYLNPSPYGAYYENEDKLYESIGLRLPGEEKFDYKRISVDLTTNQTIGHVTTTLVWNDVEYNLNGMFLTEAYKEGEIGYGEVNGFATAYEYADGKWAYFATGNGYEKGTVQRVYFAMDGFVFQLFVEDSKEGVEAAKEILRVMAE